MSHLLTPLHFIFYIFSGIALLSSLVVISARNPVHSVLALVVTFFGMAGVWMILHAEFLSLILILVYVGAVMTLFLFVVMMLNVSRDVNKNLFVRYLPFGVLLVLLATALIIIAIYPARFGLDVVTTPSLKPEDYSNIQELGLALYTNYFYPFQIAGVLLLAAIVAAITLTFRGPVKRLVQNPAEQVRVRAEDRVRLIKMPSEPRQGEQP